MCHPVNRISNILQVGAKALAALQNGGGESSQQLMVYPTMSGIPMVVAADLAKVQVFFGLWFVDGILSQSVRTTTN